jgi:hypothetical protein
MWILLVAFQFTTFSVILDSAEECRELGQLNVAHWAQTGQTARAVCMKTAEV